MKVLGYICLFAVALYFGIATFFAEHETILREVFAVAAAFVVLILLLVSFVLGLGAFHRERFHALVPMLICLLGLPVGFIGAIVLGESLKSARFQKNLPRYTEVVQLIKSGEIKSNPSSRHVQLPNQYSDLADATSSWTNRSGLVVNFFTDSAFPVWNAGYRYVDSGQTETDTELTKPWPSWSRINTNWFYVSD